MTISALCDDKVEYGDNRVHGQKVISNLRPGKRAQVPKRIGQRSFGGLGISSLAEEVGQGSRSVDEFLGNEPSRVPDDLGPFFFLPCPCQYIRFLQFKSENLSLTFDIEDQGRSYFWRLSKGLHIA